LPLNRFSRWMGSGRWMEGVQVRGAMLFASH
jgi:hypothetical protein